MSTDQSTPADGRKRRWDQHNAERRQRVIGAALQVLDEDVQPGEWASAQQIADKAKIHRTGIYRYFDDRADLDVAIQRVICDDLRSTLNESVTLVGTARSVAQRVVDSYIRWVVAHPAWTYVIEQNVAGAAESPLQESIAQVAEKIEFAVRGFIALVDADLTEDDLKLVGPWVSSLISGGVGAVRTWRSQDDAVDLDTFALFLADIIWMQITGLGASRGVQIPDVPLEGLFEE
ncbi:MAG: TetR/AcrR family transcriptional regulator [Rhodococcus sp. (in: high G+C Gram-positive bacteria)]